MLNVLNIWWKNRQKYLNKFPREDYEYNQIYSAETQTTAEFVNDNGDISLFLIRKQSAFIDQAASVTRIKHFFSPWISGYDESVVSVLHLVMVILAVS